jgi:hypothetical protein
VLSVRGCTEIEVLPKGLGKLINLRQLFITTKQFVLSHDEFGLHDIAFSDTVFMSTIVSQGSINFGKIFEKNLT